MLAQVKYHVCCIGREDCTNSYFLRQQRVIAFRNASKSAQCQDEACQGSVDSVAQAGRARPIRLETDQVLVVGNARHKNIDGGCLDHCGCIRSIEVSF